MGQSKSNAAMQLPRTHLALLVGGDLLVILSFVWIGRSSHNLSIADIAAGLLTASPFILSWFFITPWFGLFSAEVSRSWRKLVPRLLLAWAIAGPAALVLRSLFLGRPIFSGIIPAFAVVSLSYIGFWMLVWRLGYMWWTSRRLKGKKKARSIGP